MTHSESRLVATHLSGETVHSGDGWGKCARGIAVGNRAGGHCFAAAARRQRVCGGIDDASESAGVRGVLRGVVWEEVGFTNDR